ncbi:MAG: hypothetical protein JO144_13215 [Actinobacteria bacterium]|nr:hypothetical protein [Actinomycetota bacterium]
MPVPVLLALSGAAAVALTGGAPAGATAGRDTAGHIQPTDLGRTTGNIHTTAIGCGKGNGAGSNSHGQDCLEVTASGFLHGEPVLVREFRRPGWQLTRRADSRGEVNYRLTPAAGRIPKDDVLTFVGLGASAPAGTAGTVQVSVPRIAVYRFGAGTGS